MQEPIPGQRRSSAIDDINGDRQLFLRWFERYAAHETYDQHARDYQPFDVPSSVAEAIQQQRQFEESVVADRARDELAAHRAEQRRQNAIRAEEAAAAADLQRRNAEYDVEKAKNDAIAAKADEARLAEMKADNDCRQRRTDLSYKASMDPVNPQREIAKVMASIHCRSDGPAR